MDKLSSSLKNKVTASPPWRRDKIRCKHTTEQSSKYITPSEQKRLKKQRPRSRSMNE
jgi:hypothetical protein